MLLVRQIELSAFRTVRRIRLLSEGVVAEGGLRNANMREILGFALAILPSSTLHLPAPQNFAQISGAMIDRIVAAVFKLEIQSLAIGRMLQVLPEVTHAVVGRRVNADDEDLLRDLLPVDVVVE